MHAKTLIKVLDRGVYVVPPNRAHYGDAGIDLRSVESLAIPPRHTKMVDLGVAVAVPEGYVGLLLVRSSIGSKRSLLCTGGAGVIDAGYRGRVKLPLVNCGRSTQLIEKGERVAQLVVVPCLLGFDVVDELDATDRGFGGFGSTGSR